MTRLTLNELLRIYKITSPLRGSPERLSNAPKAIQPVSEGGNKTMAPGSGCLAGSRTESDPNAQTRQPQQGTFGSDGARTHGEEPREQCALLRARQEGGRCVLTCR